MRDAQPIQDARLYQSLLTGCQENWTNAITEEGAPDSPDQQELDEEEEIREERRTLTRESTPTGTNWASRMWRGMKTILRGQESQDKRMRRMERRQQEIQRELRRSRSAAPDRPRRH